jgi:enolase
MAASTYFEGGSYRMTGFDHPLSNSEYVAQLLDLKSRFHLFSLEDALAEDEWESWTQLTAQLGSDTMIVGDDLLVTNPNRLKIAIEKKACNAILIKLNQIGTLTETLQVIELARRNKFKIVISHRSGETVDDFIADLAIAVGADFVKFGAPARGERVVKYNRLMHIYRKSSA